MNLIKQINSILDAKLSEQQELLTSQRVITERVSLVLGVDYCAELMESAETFLNQLAGMVRAGDQIEPARVKQLAAKLAALYVLADENNQEAVLGHGWQTKLSSIITKTVNPDNASSSPIEAFLMKVGTDNAKSSTDRNTKMLSGLRGMSDAERNAMATKLSGLAKTYRVMKPAAGDARTQQDTVPA